MALLRLPALLLLVSACQATPSNSSDLEPFELHNNTNNIFSRAVLHGNNSVVKFLGTFDSLSECEAACVAMAAGPLCTSFTYHTLGFSDKDWAGGCYAVTDGSWDPHEDKEVISGRLPKGACTADADCNYNGQCHSGACKCSAQWKGAACDELNLLPADKGLGYQWQEDGQNVTSWGGSVVVGDDGTYHMYAAEIEGHCGMVSGRPI